MAFATLTGNEVVYVNGVTPAGNLAATQFPTNTAAIAALSSGGSTSLVFTALNTVGNGTVTAAAIFGKAVNRGGAQTGTPFTDTTDTAANIIAALPSGQQVVGTAFQWSYVNNTNAVATLQGGTGVTVSGVTTLQANSYARYIVTYSAAATVTIVGIEYGNFISTGTFVATGTTPVSVSNTVVTVGSDIGMTLKTVGGTVGSPGLKTITPGTGFTVASTALDTSTYNYTVAG